jgi:hypothetical protein
MAADHPAARHIRLLRLGPVPAGDAVETAPIGAGMVLSPPHADIDDLGRSGTIWDDLGRSGTIWDDLKRSETIWTIWTIWTL